MLLALIAMVVFGAVSFFGSSTGGGFNKSAACIKAAYENRYYLSDDYYAAVLPFSAFGREVYLPQFAIGRLVETPAQIENVIDVYRNGYATINPQNALVTGYDFLIDQADAVSAELNARGVTNQTTLLNNAWRAWDFRDAAFASTSYDLISLNSHFDHMLFYPNGSPTEQQAGEPNLVYADELDDVSTDFTGALVFSVGCQSGLNVSDRWYAPGAPFAGADWAQMFAGEGATFLGNTGFGYGDVDLLAYSEKLMFNFVQHLGYNPTGQAAGDPSVGGALLAAKQQYFNSLAAGSLSVYDEKVLAEMTLYGLPMQKVEMPNQTNVDPDGTAAVMQSSAAVAPASMTTAGNTPAQAPIAGLNQTTLNLDFDYAPENTTRGDYYRIQGESDLYQTAERPILPLTTINRDSPDKVARGVLMLGGTFEDVPNFDPVIMGLLFEDSNTISGELRHDVDQWLPFMPATINRFWNIGEGAFSQKIVVTPGQFKATSTSSDPKTVGVMRLYSHLELLVYEGPGEEPDYKAPGVWQVAATPGTNKALTFSALVTDTPATDFLPATGVLRVVVLYRHENDTTWSRAELIYNPTSQLAVKTVVLPHSGQYEFFVQAVDNAGNVNPVLDHGNYFTVNVPNVDPQPDDRIIYVSAREAGSVDGIAYDTNDILAYDPVTDSWSLYFDGADVGITSNLYGFSLLSDGSILLTPQTRFYTPATGWVEPQDIVRFTPTALGPNTAGTFSVFLDGSDVGLLTSNEAINGISFTPAGRLVISTLGNATIPGPGGQTMNTTGDVMLRFQANTLGTGTSGYWEPYLDGGALGLDNNRISAQWIDPLDGKVYFTPRLNVTIDNQSFTASDIVRCVPLNAGPITGCALSTYWAGGARGAGLRIESMDVGQGLPFEPPAGSITIVKQTVSGSGTFNFNGDLGAFSLDVPGDAQRTFTDLETGAYSVRELAAAGWQVNSITCNDPDGGTAVIANDRVLIDLDADEAITCTFVNEPDNPQLGETIYLTVNHKGTVTGVSYEPADILRYTAAGQWELYFDGSDVGLGTASINAFTLLPDSSILMSINKSMNVGTIGRVSPEDVVRFIPTTTGANTAGTFQMYFDGSDVSLFGRAESIDALTVDSSGKLIISTRGKATIKSPPNTLKTTSQDLLAFTFATTGSSTSGSWSLYFQGADVGLGRENVDAVWVDPANGDIYLSVANRFDVGGGVSGGGSTVFICAPGSLGPTTTCTYRSFWDAADAGMNTNISGLFIQR